MPFVWTTMPSGNNKSSPTTHSGGLNRLAPPARGRAEALAWLNQGQTRNAIQEEAVSKIIQVRDVAATPKARPNLPPPPSSWFSGLRGLGNVLKNMKKTDVAAETKETGGWWSLGNGECRIADNMSLNLSLGRSSGEVTPGRDIIANGNSGGIRDRASIRTPFYHADSDPDFVIGSDGGRSSGSTDFVPPPPAHPRPAFALYGTPAPVIRDLTPLRSAHITSLSGPTALPDLTVSRDRTPGPQPASAGLDPSSLRAMQLARQKLRSRAMLAGVAGDHPEDLRMRRRRDNAPEVSGFPVSPATASSPPPMSVQSPALSAAADVSQTAEEDADLGDLVSEDEGHGYGLVAFLYETEEPIESADDAEMSNHGGESQDASILLWQRQVSLSEWD